MNDPYEQYLLRNTALQLADNLATRLGETNPNRIIANARKFQAYLEGAGAEPGPDIADMAPIA